MNELQNDLNNDFRIVYDDRQIENLENKLTDEELLELLKKWNDNGDVINRKINIEGEENYKYYIGSYDRDMELDYDLSHLKINRIFGSIKGVVPFVTSKPAEPVIYDNKFIEDEQKRNESRVLASMTQEVVKAIYQDTQVQKKNEQNCVNRYIYKIGVLKYYIYEGKICTKVVNPQNLIFDKDAKCYEDMRYIGEIRYMEASELIEMYPKKKSEIEEWCNGKLGTLMEIIEWWTEDDYIVTFKDKEILERKKNPLYDDDRKEYNYYNKAPIPYVFLNVYNTGLGLLDDVSEIDLSKTLQDALNDLGRLIIDNARFSGSPIKVFNGIPENQASEILQNARPGNGIGLQKDQTFTYVQAQSIPPYIMQMVSTLENEIDNIFGTQATFRGESEGVQSGYSREVLRKASGDTLATISRGIERQMDKLYKGWMHLIYVFSNSPEFIENQLEPVLGERTPLFLELLNNNIGDGMEISVQAGSMLPDDKLAQRQEAIELAQYGKISTRLLYERLGIQNPDQEAETFEDEAIKAQLRGKELEFEFEQKRAQLQANTQAQTQGTQVANQEYNTLLSEIDGMGAEESLGDIAQKQDADMEMNNLMQEIDKMQ